MLGFRTIGEYALCEFETLVEAPPPVPPDPPDPGDPPTQETPPTPLPTVTQRYSTRSFVTRATDTPANDFIARRLNRGLVVGRRINAGPDGQFGGLIVSSFGEIEFVNTDGGLDFLADDYFIDGRTITIKAGQTEIDSAGREVVEPFDSFVTAYTAVAGAWSIEHDLMRLRIRDPGIILQRQLQTATYGGTGGQQGTEDMAGRTVPVCLGRCLNVLAQQVDPVYLIYQVHDSSVEGIPTVYDAGVSVPGEGAGSPAAITDYATYALLQAATVTAGTFATCLASGHFRLGTSPVGTVTADVDGDNTGGDWVATHGTILRRILTKYSWLDTAKIDHNSFAAFSALNPAIMGLFLPAGDESTIEQAIERVALSGGAVCGQDKSGLYRVVRLDPPTASPLFSFDGDNMMRIERVPPAYGVPFKSWAVEGARNWTTQRGGDLATGVSQSRRRFLEAEARHAKVDVPTVDQAHPTSASAVRPSLFHLIDDAETEAIRLATFYALGRTLYQTTAKTVLFDVEIGDTVRITYPRWNLAQGRNFIVISVTDDTDAAETELEVFG